MMSQMLRISLLGLMLTLGTQVQAAIINYTGLDLYNDSDVSFNAGSPTVSGDSLIFDTGGMDFVEFFEISIFDAGFLNNYNSGVHFSVAMNMTQLTSDWDPGFVISDGSHSAGIFATDNEGGQAIGAEFLDTGIDEQRVGWDVLKSGLGYAGGVGSSIDFLIDYYIEDSFVNIDLTFNGSTSRFTSSFLDTSAALSFMFLSENDPESYQLNTISVSAPTAIPEPYTFALMLAGLVLLSQFRNNANRQKLS